MYLFVSVPMVQHAKVFNPRRTTFVIGIIKIHKNVISLLHIGTAQEVEILPSEIQESTYSKQSISWALISWRQGEPGHQLPWYLLCWKFVDALGTSPLTRTGYTGRTMAIPWLVTSPILQEPHYKQIDGILPNWLSGGLYTESTRLWMYRSTNGYLRLTNCTNGLKQSAIN